MPRYAIKPGRGKHHRWEGDENVTYRPGEPIEMTEAEAESHGDRLELLEEPKPKPKRRTRKRTPRKPKGS